MSVQSCGAPQAPTAPAPDGNASAPQPAPGGSAPAKVPAGPPPPPQGGTAPKNGGAPVPKAPPAGGTPQPAAPAPGETPPKAYVPPGELPPDKTSANGTQVATGYTNSPPLPDPKTLKVFNAKDINKPIEAGQPVLVTDPKNKTLWKYTPGKTPDDPGTLEYIGKVSKDTQGIEKGMMPADATGKNPPVAIPVPPPPDKTKKPFENGMQPANEALKNQLPNVPQPYVDKDFNVWSQGKDGTYTFHGTIKNGEFWPA